MRFSSPLPLVLAFAAESAGTRVLSLDGDAELNKGLPAGIFHHLGQYSPRYDVQSGIWPVLGLPAGCEVVQVNSLERHGARHQTSGDYKRTQATLNALQSSLSGINASSIRNPSLRFLKDVTISNTTDLLVPYGALEGYYSGLSTNLIYPSLREREFVRASSSDRVVVTAEYWKLGFANQSFPAGNVTTSDQTRSKPGLPAPDVIIPEASGSNNTLGVKTCTAAQNLSPDPEDTARGSYANSTIVPTIGARLHRDLSPANVTLSGTDILNLMGLCSFETLGNAYVLDGRLHLDEGMISPFCDAFEDSEWELYGYANDVGKYYGAGYGNPYYRALGQGYLRELLARLTATPPPLADPTSLNSTLDRNPATFPLPSNNTANTTAPAIFMDASHDNNIGPIAAAFGLFDGPQLETTFHADRQPHVWSASKIVPFQGKIVFELIQCGAPSKSSKGDKGSESNAEDRYVRVRANGAVQPSRGQSWCPDHKTKNAGANPYAAHGLCPLETVVQALEWVNGDEEWNKCFST